MFGHILTSQCKDSLKLNNMDICVLFPNHDNHLKEAIIHSP